MVLPPFSLAVQRMQPQQFWPRTLQSRPLVESDPTGRSAGPGVGLSYVAKLAYDEMPANIQTCKRMMLINSNLDNANANEALLEDAEEPPLKKKGRKESCANTADIQLHKVRLLSVYAHDGEV